MPPRVVRSGDASGVGASLRRALGALVRSVDTFSERFPAQLWKAFAAAHGAVCCAAVFAVRTEWSFCKLLDLGCFLVSWLKVIGCRSLCARWAFGGELCGLFVVGAGVRPGTCSSSEGGGLCADFRVVSAG